MVMRAEEARRQAEEINKETYGRLVGRIDSGIENAAYGGEFSYTTEALTNSIGEKITAKYTELGYEVIHKGNHTYTINW